MNYLGQENPSVRKDLSVGWTLLSLRYHYWVYIFQKYIVRRQEAILKTNKQENKLLCLPVTSFQQFQFTRVP